MGRTRDCHSGVEARDVSFEWTTMNLQTLIDELLALQPISARDAQVVIGGDVDSEITSVVYEHGVVTINVENYGDEKEVD